MFLYWITTSSWLLRWVCDFDLLVGLLLIDLLILFLCLGLQLVLVDLLFFNLYLFGAVCLCFRLWVSCLFCVWLFGLIIIAFDWWFRCYFCTALAIGCDGLILLLFVVCICVLVCFVVWYFVYCCFRFVLFILSVYVWLANYRLIVMVSCYELYLCTIRLNVDLLCFVYCLFEFIVLGFWFIVGFWFCCLCLFALVLPMVVSC